MPNLKGKVRSARHRLLNQSGRNRDAVFIWIPKSAGTSVYNSLDALGCAKIKDEGRLRRVFPQKGLVTFVHLDYAALREAKLVSDTFDESAVKFTITRDPYARAVSLYFYIRDRHKLFEQWHRQPSFEEFLELIDGGFYDRIGIYNVRGMSQANPQVEWTRKTKLDYVGKMEELDATMERISQLLQAELPPVPWLNKGSAKSDKTQGMFDRRTRYLVDKIYEEDFDTFGYERHA